MNKAILNYILSFLCDNFVENPEQYVSYGKNTECIEKPIHIIQSDFFDDDIYLTKKSEPVLPLKIIEDIPILYGEPFIKNENGKTVIYADIIASTFFLITRYEELIKKNSCDNVGRFIGKKSLPYQASFISLPVVDCYGVMLRNILRKHGIILRPEKESSFKSISLTHDVDIPWEHFTIISAIKRTLGIFKREKKINFFPIKAVFGNHDGDPQYSFDKIIEQDKKINDAFIIYFVKSGGTVAPQDGYIYINDSDYKALQKKLLSANAEIGYHVSFEAGENTSLITHELKVLRQRSCLNITKSRNHYLLSENPLDLRELIDNGITDDYTMAYADVAGFRLGTCRSVKWIDPVEMKVTDLILHPLTIMDCSLTSPLYMDLNDRESKEYGELLIQQTYKYNGDLTLLWHNNVNVGNSDNLEWNNYVHFIKYIKNIQY